ncbi:MAG: HEPN domain-containing protein [Ardenticatenales bacterium]
MRNRDLAIDYVRRCKARLAAIDTLFEQESWPDVVRESQEVVELALKACLRHFGIEAPRIHDVSEVLVAESDHLPPSLRTVVPDLATISRSLRRDRELAFCGAEDLTPLDFYSRADAEVARDGARRVVQAVADHVK